MDLRDQNTFDAVFLLCSAIGVLFGAMMGRFLSRKGSKPLTTRSWILIICLMSFFMCLPAWLDSGISLSAKVLGTIATPIFGICYMLAIVKARKTVKSLWDKEK